MIANRGLGLGVLLVALVACAVPGCGRSQANAGDDVAQGGANDAPGTKGDGPGDGTTVGGVGDEGGGPGVALGGAGSEPCEPGTRVCDGPSIRVCGADGHALIEKTCSLSQVCTDGECHAIACVPGSTLCRDGVVRTCNDDGTDSAVTEECAADQFCVEHDGVAECSATACVPDSLACLDDLATRCKADGSGFKTGGVDCTATSQLCQGGKCVDPTCTPGEKLCQNDDVYLCVGGGAKAVLFTDCAADEACDPGLAACRPRVCEPGKLGCDDTRVVSCNDLGTGWDQTATDCQTTNQACVSGGCKTPTCVPGSTFCQGFDIYQCDALGVTSKYSQTCASSYSHCTNVSASTATCTYNTCTPGAVMCVGNVSTKCKADGSGAMDGGTDCGTDALCDYYSGACKAKVCTPYTYFCKDTDLYYCQDGTYSYASQICADDAPCGKTDTGAACIPYKCWPGLKACIGNQLGTCAEDGATLATIKQDCNDTSEVCTGGGACAASAVDTLGAAEELASLTTGMLFGDVIDVFSNRKLTQMEANVVLAGSRDLRWVVFELVSGNYVARWDQVVTGQSASGYVSSGAMSYTLKAGKRYLLGVAVTGGGIVPYYDAAPWQPDVSFGNAVGGLTSTYATTFYGYGLDASRLFDVRITTELP